jgi:hypothetical protein
MSSERMTVASQPMVANSAQIHEILILHQDQRRAALLLQPLAQVPNR